MKLHLKEKSRAHFLLEVAIKVPFSPPGFSILLRVDRERMKYTFDNHLSNTLTKARQSCEILLHKLFVSNDITQFYNQD